MAIWQLCANLLIPNCLRSNLSYSPLAALELYVISDKSKFAFDFLGEYIPEATSFYMKGECIEYLLSALNSSVSEWLFSKVGTTTGVGTIRWKKYTIEQLIVAKLSTEQLNTHLAAFNDLKVGKMSITDFECFSNKLMYDVYKLTSDEIQYIENQQIV